MSHQPQKKGRACRHTAAIHPRLCFCQNRPGLAAHSGVGARMSPITTGTAGASNSCGVGAHISQIPAGAPASECSGTSATAADCEIDVLSGDVAPTRTALTLQDFLSSAPSNSQQPRRPGRRHIDGLTIRAPAPEEAGKTLTCCQCRQSLTRKILTGTYK